MTTEYRGNLGAENTDRFPSMAIWASFPMMEHLQRKGRFQEFFEDFTLTTLLETAAVDDEQLFASYIDTGNTIQPLPTEKNRGVLRLATDATDNDGPVITMCGNVGANLMISDTAGDDKKLWFEARWKKSSITDNQCAMFIGLTEEARAVDNGLLTDDAGILADIDHIGFNVAHDNGEELNWAYTKAGQVDTEVIAAMDSLVADTYVKTGFVYDPARDTANRIAAYLNNVEQSTYVTGTNIAAATFPDAEEMCFSAGSKNGEATATNFDIDWIGFAQVMLES